jgi:hypothetical protein
VRTIGVFVGIGAFVVGIGAGVTSAAWVDQASFSAAIASTGTFDIQGRFAESDEEFRSRNSTAPWEDIGLPGNPDTYPPGFEIVIPPISDVLPGHSYAGDVFLCNAGSIDGVITGATLEEVTVNAQGGASAPLVLVGSIQVTNIDVGTIIPALSCAPPSVQNPPNDVEGVIHFTTVDDFTGRYGATSSIVIRIGVNSCPASPAPCTESTTTGWIDRGGSKMVITAIANPVPVPENPVVPGTGTTFVSGPIWTGQGTNPNPTPTLACFTVGIRTTSATLAPWTVQLRTYRPPFDNRPPFTGFQGQLFGESNSYSFTPAADYASTGIYLMTPTQPNQYASTTQTYTAKVCAVNTPEPQWQPAGPTTYTQLSPLQLVRNGSQPCVAGTVQGHQPYFVGFTLIFNWKTFLDQQLAASAITPAEYNQWLPFTRWAGGPTGFLPSQGATGTDYQVSLQGYSAQSRTVSNIANVTIASCAF